MEFAGKTFALDLAGMKTAFLIKKIQNQEAALIDVTGKDAKVPLKYIEEWFKNGHLKQTAKFKMAASTLVSPKDLHDLLTSAITEWDRRQENKAGYNPHALSQYLQAVETVVDDYENNFKINRPHDWKTEAETSLGKVFDDRLLDFLVIKVKAKTFANFAGAGPDSVMASMKITKEVKAWYPTDNQEKYWEALQPLWKEFEASGGESEGFIKIAVDTAKEMGLKWQDLATMAGYEGYFQHKDPFFVLRRIRNAGSEVMAKVSAMGKGQ